MRSCSVLLLSGLGAGLTATSISCTPTQSRCDLQEIANDILGEQSPKRLFVVRGKLYELLTNCIPPELILRRLMLELIKKLDDELKHQAAQLAAFYEHRLQVSLTLYFCLVHCPCCAMRLGSTPKMSAYCMLKYYTFS